MIQVNGLEYLVQCQRKRRAERRCQGAEDEEIVCVSRKTIAQNAARIMQGLVHNVTRRMILKHKLTKN